MDERFYQLHQRAVEPPRTNQSLLSPALARELGAAMGESELVRIEALSAISGESVHGRREEAGRSFRTTVREVATRDAMGEFSLSPGQGDVRAIFLPLSRLQREFDLHGRANTLVSAGRIDGLHNLQLADAGLKMRSGQIEHESLIIPDRLVAAVQQFEPSVTPVLTYLANTIRVNGREVPYSLVAARDEPGLAAGDILLTDWVASDASARVGQTVELEYYVWEASGRLQTQKAQFTAAGITPLRPEDRDLAPEYPGISGAGSVAEWDPPFPIELKRIRAQDEAFWERYRATPKAYVSLATGQNLWGSKHGSVTSLRVPSGFDAQRVTSRLTPEQAGLTVVDVRAQAEQASAGSTNFSEYFLYFSFFLVVSAILLASLFFRLGLEQRASEISLLRSVGYSGAVLRKLFLYEGLVLAAAGGLMGIAGAALYSALLLLGLRTWWFDAVGTRDLAVHWSPMASLLALGTTMVLAPIVILLSLRSFLRRAPRQGLATRQRSRYPLVAVACLLAGVTLLFIREPAAFFGAGALLLIGCLLLVRWQLRGAPGGISSPRSMGIRYNTARPGRSTACVALIASAAFLIVSVDAFRRGHESGEPGWRYYAESSLPLYHNPNTEEGRDALNLATVPEAKWLALRLRPGDDASCLNLYAPRNPRIVGVPASYLKLPAAEDDTVAAAVDANTLQYVLHRKPGDVLEVGGVKLRISSVLQNSIFQSELLISDTDFQRVFPQEGGFRVFLADAQPGAEGAFEEALADFGFDMTTTAERLAAYHRVENTWLSTFQALGGLGLVLGTLGLGAVMFRNVLERHRELALMRAAGFKVSDLQRVIFFESLSLLIAGLVAGTVCALVAVVPTVVERGGSIPFLSISAVLLAVFLAGLLASFLAVRSAARTPLLDALRSE
ncbi:MAG TPA: FtsX-like permease family protein [Bryobacteraceae bacterium]|nr:FtsX-like permease family protein [Bryobacteraceae bacterium]